jgi:hypothetical protein
MQATGLLDVIRNVRNGSLSAVVELLDLIRGGATVDKLQAAAAKLAASLGFQVDAKEINDLIDEIQDKDLGGSLSEAGDILKLFGEKFRKTPLPTTGGGSIVALGGGIEAELEAYKAMLTAPAALAEGEGEAQPQFILELIAGIGLLINVIRFIRERRAAKPVT